MTYREALNLACAKEMKRDPRVFVDRGGGRPVRRRLQGDPRPAQGIGRSVWVDTPIAESGFTGVGIGAADGRAASVVEMMTFNFALHALDSDRELGREDAYMSAAVQRAHRIAAGGPAHQLAAQHSPVDGGVLLPCAGLKVVRPSTPMDAKGS